MSAEKIHEPLVAIGWPMYPAVETSAEDFAWMVEKSRALRALRGVIWERRKRRSGRLHTLVLKARLELEWARYDRRAKKIRKAANQ